MRPEVQCMLPAQPLAPILEYDHNFLICISLVHKAQEIKCETVKAMILPGHAEAAAEEGLCGECSHTCKAATCIIRAAS